MSEPTNELDVVTSSDSSALIRSFADPSGSVYSTVSKDTFAGKLAIVDAMSNAVPLSEHYNQPFKLKDFVVQAIAIADNKTGEEIRTVRTVLIADDGRCFAAVSEGVVKALQNLTGVLGHPREWDAPIEVVATQDKARSGFTFTTLRLTRAVRAK